MSSLRNDAVMVAENLAKHKDALNALHSSLADAVQVCQGAEHLARQALKNPSEADPLNVPLDDIFFLRFLLSYGSLSAAEQPLRDTLHWRAANAPLLLARRLGKSEPPHHPLIQPYCIQDNHGHAKDGSPFFIVRSGLANLNAMMNLCSPDMVAEWMLFMREPDFYLCDTSSRQSDRLIKMVSVIDFNHSSMLHSMNRSFFQALGISSKASERYYPQLLGFSVMANPPFFMSAFMTVARPLMSKKTLEKMKICSGKTTSQSVLSCPFASQAFGSPATVPTFLGGTCTCSEKGLKGCIQNCPNDATKPVDAKLDIHALALKFEKEEAGGPIKEGGVTKVNGREYKWQKISVPPKGSQTINVGSLQSNPAQGGIISFLAFFPAPEKDGSGLHLHLSAITESTGATINVFQDRKIKVHDTASSWVSTTAGAVDLTARIENKDGKKEIMIGFCVISGEVLLDAASKVGEKKENGENVVVAVESGVTAETGTTAAVPDAEVDAIVEGVKNVSV